MKKNNHMLKLAALISSVSLLALAGCHSNRPVINEPIQEKPVSYPGNDIDAQEKELANFLTDQGINYSRSGANLIISLPESISFNSGSAALQPQAVNSLKFIGSVLKKYTQTTVNVIGHTDSTGSDAINDKLSLQRAQNVTKILSAEGVGDFRIKAIGAGSKQPIASNDTAAGKAQNRRVEIILMPLQLKR